jgi:hypothetical protein
MMGINALIRAIGPWHDVDIGTMVGSVVLRASRDEDSITFETDRGTWLLRHERDCCEEVTIEEVNIDLATVAGLVTRAEEASSVGGLHGDAEGKEDAWGDSWTWTFYRFCIGGQDFEARWFGQSNGYYSEDVDVTFTSKG